MDVSILVTCWNGEKLLSHNFSKVVEAAENKDNKVKEILVVDDGSSDNSVSFLKKNFPQVKVLENKRNYGYGFSCNRGMEEAKADLVAILNLDVIPDKDFLVSCLPHFEDEKVFSVSFNEGSFGPGRLAWNKGFIEIVETKPEKTTSFASWPSGGSSVFRKKLWREIGGMDEIFLPFYFEDIDLGIRAEKKGYKCLWEPKAKVNHKHEATINPENFALHKHKKDISLIKERNFLLLNWKHLDSPSDFFNHLVYLFKRAFFAPGYFKVIFSAILRKISFSFTHEQL
ncbi:glycosyltransferase family 2 protein [Candidatus Microgenomates bacterium]|jgi:GT2 family glycosyltransferase|nr:MAG: glycosyltransferase family 2 protein [Candidatus Microgenomates bacterium]